MNLVEFFKKVTHEFNKQKLRYALAGGMVASLYRHTPRSTQDLDFYIFTGGSEEEVASKIIENFGLKAIRLNKAQIEGGPQFAMKKKKPICMILGRKDHHFGLDFILPEIPWSEGVIERAELNKINFGFGEIPCLTVEDVIISKLYTYNNQKNRFMDLDDLKTIFENENTIDASYITNKVNSLKLRFPKEINEFIPKSLKSL